ncbi:MAG: DUF1249 domain-containing protein [Thiotrichaceae bacterium]
MLKTERHSSIYTPRPHSFADLMQMYEANYIRLRLLCGNIRRLSNEVISNVQGGVPVSLKTVEQTRHTTTIMLTYIFAEEAESIRRPDLLVRIYHDSRQAEVLSRRCSISGSILRPWEENVDSVLLCRWRLNRFLFKWAGYIHRQGHSFNTG